MSEDEESVDSPRDESLIMTLGKMLLLILMGTALAGQFITGSPMWGYKGKWTNVHTYLAPFTVSRFIDLRRRTTLRVTVTGLADNMGSRARSCSQKSNWPSLTGQMPHSHSTSPCVTPYAICLTV